MSETKVLYKNNRISPPASSPMEKNSFRNYNHDIRESILEEDLNDILNGYMDDNRTPLSTIKQLRRQSSIYNDTISIIEDDDIIDEFEFSNYNKKRKLINLNQNDFLKFNNDPSISPKSKRFTANSNITVQYRSSFGSHQFFKTPPLNSINRSSHLITNGLNPTESSQIGNNFYNLSSEDIYGNQFEFCELKNKVILVVNLNFFGKLAIKNFEYLNYLHDMYSKNGLIIIGFPCDQFNFKKKKSNSISYESDNKLNFHKRSVSLSDLNNIVEKQREIIYNNNQELEKTNQIQKIIEKYDIKFPIFMEVKVNGNKTSTIYNFLKNDKKGLFNTKFIKWDFEKFLIDKNGNVIKRFSFMKNFKHIEMVIKNLLNDDDQVVIDNCHPIIGFNKNMFA